MLQSITCDVKTPCQSHQRNGAILLGTPSTTTHAVNFASWAKAGNAGPTSLHNSLLNKGFATLCLLPQNVAVRAHVGRLEVKAPRSTNVGGLVGPQRPATCPRFQRTVVCSLVGVGGDLEDLQATTLTLQCLESDVWVELHQTI